MTIFTNRLVEVFKISSSVRQLHMLYEQTMQDYVNGLATALSRLFRHEISPYLWSKAGRREFIQKTPASLHHNPETLLQLPANITLINPNLLLVEISIRIPLRNATLTPAFFATWDGYMYSGAVCAQFADNKKAYAVLSSTQYENRDLQTSP